MGEEILLPINVPLPGSVTMMGSIVLRGIPVGLSLLTSTLLLPTQTPHWYKPYLRQALAYIGLERYEDAVEVIDVWANQKGVHQGTAAAGMGVGEDEQSVDECGGRLEEGQEEPGIRQEMGEVRNAATAAAQSRAAKRRRVEERRMADDPVAQALALLRKGARGWSASSVGGGLKPQGALPGEGGKVTFSSQLDLTLPPGSPPRRPPVPVTVLSGFLGAGGYRCSFIDVGTSSSAMQGLTSHHVSSLSGKTTLLQHLLDFISRQPPLQPNPCDATSDGAHEIKSHGCGRNQV